REPAVSWRSADGVLLLLTGLTVAAALLDEGELAVGLEDAELDLAQVGDALPPGLLEDFVDRDALDPQGLVDHVAVAYDDDGEALHHPAGAGQEVSEHRRHRDPEGDGPHGEEGSRHRPVVLGQTL